jgi:hypothetical protein
MKPVREVDVAKLVVDRLIEEGWEVYQEVKTPFGIADFVAKFGPIIWVFEAKTSLSIDLLMQAERWRPWAHYVSIVTPVRKDTKDFVRKLLKDWGVGWFGVDNLDGAHADPRLREIQEPEYQHRAPKQHKHVIKWWSKFLAEEQKTFAAAGTPRGSVWSPFKKTCVELREYVRQNQGCTLSSAIQHIKHHYSSHTSARSSLKLWLERGKVPGVKMGWQGNSLRLWAD